MTFLPRPWLCTVTPNHWPSLISFFRGGERFMESIAIEKWIINNSLGTSKPHLQDYLSAIISTVYNHKMRIHKNDFVNPCMTVSLKSCIFPHFYYDVIWQQAITIFTQQRYIKYKFNHTRLQYNNKSFLWNQFKHLILNRYLSK